MPFDCLPEPPRHIKMLRLAKINIGHPQLWAKGCQWNFENGENQMCAVQSVILVCAPDTDDIHPLIGALAKSLPLRYRIGLFFLSNRRKVIAYNDSRWTDHVKIMKLFDLAIARIRSEMAHV